MRYRLAPELVKAGMVSSIKIQGLNEWLLSFERLVSVSNSEDRSWPGRGSAGIKLLAEYRTISSVSEHHNY